jgi:hypothetical protein
MESRAFSRTAVASDGSTGAELHKWRGARLLRSRSTDLSPRESGAVDQSHRPRSCIHAAEGKQVLWTDRHAGRRVDAAPRLAAGEEQVSDDGGRSDLHSC